MTLSPSGLSTAVADAVALAEPSQAMDAAQGSLFGLIPADPMGVGELSEAGEDLRRGRGRPVGSKNKSTTEWARFLLSRYRSPLIGLAEVAQAKPAELAAELGCNVADALRIIMQAARDLAPYLHARQPLALQGNGLSLFSVVIGDIGQDEGAGGALFEALTEDQQNQALSLMADDVSEDGERNE